MKYSLQLFGSWGSKLKKKKKKKKKFVWLLFINTYMGHFELIKLFQPQNCVFKSCKKTREIIHAADNMF